VAKKTAKPRATAPAANGVTAELAELRELVVHLAQQLDGLTQSTTAMQSAISQERVEREATKRTEAAAAATSAAQMAELAPLLAKSGIDLQGCPAHSIIQRGCPDCRQALLIKAMTNMGGG